VFLFCDLRFFFLSSYAVIPAKAGISWSLAVKEPAVKPRDDEGGKGDRDRKAKIERLE